MDEDDDDTKDGMPGLLSCNDDSSDNDSSDDDSDTDENNPSMTQCMTCWHTINIPDEVVSSPQQDSSTEMNQGAAVAPSQNTGVGQNAGVGKRATQNSIVKAIDKDEDDYNPDHSDPTLEEDTEAEINKCYGQWNWQGLRDRNPKSYSYWYGFD